MSLPPPRTLGDLDTIAAINTDEEIRRYICGREDRPAAEREPVFRGACRHIYHRLD
jgi:hypothetical protein